MYTRKTGTIAFRIGDNESSGRGTVQYRSLNPTGAWDRHWPTILKSWSTPDTGTCTQLNSWLHKDNNADRITCSSASPTKTISLNLITHWEQKRIHSYKDSNGSRRTKQELLNKLLTWKRTQHVQRSENVTATSESGKLGLRVRDWGKKTECEWRGGGSGNAEEHTATPSAILRNYLCSVDISCCWPPTNLSPYKPRIRLFVSFVFCRFYCFIASSPLVWFSSKFKLTENIQNTYIKA